MTRIALLFVAFIAACIILIGDTTVARAEDIPYSVTDKPWPESWGKHRARIQVAQAADAVWAHIEWRRRDTDPARKQIIVVDAATGKPVANLVRADIRREFGDIVFQPVTAPGEYDVYYLPFKVQEEGGWYGGDYLPVESKADPAWVTRNALTPEGLAQGSFRKLPQTKTTEIQARTQFSNMDPMEVIATPEETQALVATHRDKPYLLFPEDRDHPIWMTDDIPHLWVKRGPTTQFTAEACRNEFRAFQIGLYAATQAIEEVAVRFGTLKPEGAGKAIPGSEFHCFNLGGVNYDGQPLTKIVSVPQGKVQALWCGVQIPKDAAPGKYHGMMTVEARNAPPTQVALEFTVTPKVLADCGDSDLWRFSRLRWLDSTLAIDDEVTKPYTPLKVDGHTVSCLGRTLSFGADGLPTSIRAGAHEILAAPLSFVIETPQGPVPVVGGPPKITKIAPGAIVWETTGKAGDLAAHCTARMEYDGHVTFSVALKADKDTPVNDIRLEMPFRREIARYLMGCGHNGGYRPKEWDWKWGGQIYYDSFWMGDVPAGVQCELRGADYCGPMVNLYWSLGQLKPPTTWDNGGKGGLTVREAGDKVLATAYSGPRTLEAGKEMRFEFALLITPVKPLDTASQFRNRYYHSYEPVDKIAKTGANVINIHHATEINPYINYPFLTTDKMRAYVDAAHKLNMKVKFYYTLREMTNHVTEMPALRSLGHEVIAPGGGGGYPWLQEHLGSDYSCSWYQQQPDGEACAAIVNSGTSRWYNYYIEGLGWLVKNVKMDGIYIDDVSYDREIIRRVRKTFDRNRPGCMIDLHSNTGFSHGPANQYMEFFPYIDRLWFGESFNYDESPDYWLTEISGIPYGLMGEMLQNGGNKWRGMIYGMTARMPWSGDPRSVWKVWDDFGIDKAKMIGYWDPTCPVRTDNKDVLATAYVRDGKTLIAVASWAKKPAKCQLKINWKAIGLDPAKTHLYAPAVPDYQEAALFGPTDTIPVMPGKGWLLIADHEKHDAPAYTLQYENAYAKRKLLLEDNFMGTKLIPDWQVTLSKRPGTSLEVRDGKVAVTCLAHTTAYARRPLPSGTTLVQCRIDTGTDGGMTWGPGVALRWGDKFLRLNLRTVEGRVGVDDGTNQYLVPSGIVPATTYYLRLRLEADGIAAETSEDGEWWTQAKAFPRTLFLGDPTEVLIGKMDGHGGDTDADQPPNPEGACSISELRVYGAK